MFKKLMAKLGVGAATVDLRLDRESYRLGETMSGAIHVKGGAVEQRITELSVVVMMKAHVKGQEVTRPIQTIPVLQGFTVQPEPYIQEIPFTYSIPKEMAVTTSAITYFLHTKLDVELALDPTDVDYFRVLPHAPVEKVIHVLEQIGFRQKADSGKLTRYGQEFSFYPAETFRHSLNELEIIFFETEDELRLLVEFDITQGFFRKEIERKAEISIPREYLQEGHEEELTKYLYEKIDFCISNPGSIPFVSLAQYREVYPGHKGHGVGGMVGGMAAGLLGGLLLGEMMDEAGELLGMDEDDFEDAGSDDFDGGDFGDFE